jgi:hypothetical protein
MKAEQFSNQLKQFSAALVQELPRINESVAMNAFAMVRDRVVNEGKKGDGSSLGTYSDNELPLFFYTGKALNKDGEAAVEKAKKAKKGLSYEDWREANNRPVDRVTISFSGDTWKDTGVVKELIDGNKVNTTIGAKNTKDRGGKSTDDIMSYNQDRYGDYLIASKEEEKKLAVTYDRLLQQLIDKSF